MLRSGEGIQAAIAAPRPSISAFFPCYNDAGSIAIMVTTVAETLRGLTDDFEVIVVNDGSQDQSAEVLAELQQRCSFLRVVTHASNRGYGGALRSGFEAATKDLVFYTDGDAQYDPRELAGLYAELAPDIDVVQGWKVQRHDAFYRAWIGQLYRFAVRGTFGLHVRDVDCDFRLIRRYVLDSFQLTRDSGSITVELVARVEQGGFRIHEAPVHHYARLSGHSQFFNIKHIAATLWQLGGLWLDLRLGAEQPAPLLGAVAARVDVG